jgi:uroporphyrinogen III methyltransferase/synthase
MMVMPISRSGEVDELLRDMLERTTTAAVTAASGHPRHRQRPDVSRTAVYLVGAGPGDPGLLTLRGVECLESADVVLYDYLVNPAILEHAPATAELIPLGRRITGRGLSPDAIADRMIAEAKRGKTVVRLKGGDPSVFARGADEEAALRAAGVTFEIVPGITAGLAVAAYCEIPITQQDDASAVALVTGRERDAKTVSRLDYGALASFPGTLILYMGVTRAGEWSKELIAHGKSPDTPVAIVRWCTRAEQHRVRCTLGSAAAVIAEHGIRPPAVIVVGDVVRRAPERAWFDARPLFGVRVLVPGSAETSQTLRALLTRLGADAIIQPAIRTTDPPDWAPMDDALEHLDRHDWLVFTNATGVDYFMRRLFARGQDVRRLAAVQVAAIGAGTADRLARYHVRPEHNPEEYEPAGLARTLVAEGRGQPVLLVRPSQGAEALAQALTDNGATVTQVAAYASHDVEEPDPDVAAALSAAEIGWIAVTSSSAARALDRLYGTALRRARFATIGPLASATLRGLGYEPAAEAQPQTTAGLADAILHAQLADD